MRASNEQRPQAAIVTVLRDVFADDFLVGLEQVEVTLARLRSEFEGDVQELADVWVASGKYGAGAWLGTQSGRPRQCRNVRESAWSNHAAVLLALQGLRRLPQQVRYRGADLAIGPA